MKMKVSNVFIKNIKGLLEGNAHIVNQGGTRSTKTHSKMQEYIVIAVLRKDTDLFMVGKTHKIVKLTLYKYLKKILGRDFRKFGTYLKSEGAYIFNNGSTITFISAENAEDYHGVESDFVDYEEPNIFKAGDVVTEQLSMRCKGVSSYTLNPSRRLDWLKKIQERDDCKYIHSTYKDNRFLSKNVVKEIEERSKNDERYRMIYKEGKYVANIDEAIYTNWSLSDFYPSATQSKQTVYGLDFGFANDPTALIQCDVYDSSVYVKELFRAPKMTTRQIAEELLKLPIGSTVIADNSEPRLVVELRTLVGNRITIMKTRKFKGSILTGIKKLQSQNIIVDSRSVYLIEEFELYSWKKVNGELTEKPEDKNNHGLDALRYAFLYIDGKKLVTWS